MDRLDLDGEQIRKIKHYTIADGLSDNFIVTSYRDDQDVLWFGTLRGVSKIIPQPDSPHDPLPAMISGVNAAGQRQPISELGSNSVEIPELGYTQNQLQIDFFSISYAAGDALNYQYRFDDNSSDWSAPSAQRSITLANLSPGSYRFLVRAVNSDGLVNQRPASVSFTILPPFWRRWWFIALSILVIAVLAVGFHLYRTMQLRRINRALTEVKTAEVSLRKAREERLVELERVRSRIATDLHDDIGASLTQIAILSEVVQAQTKTGHPAVAAPLTKISEVSNELVSTMSDIVWSINPTKDHVSDLTQRMRRFGSDVLTLRSIRFHFHSGADVGDIVVKSNLRREIFLVFKESINNIVKHAEARNVWAEIDVVNGDLTISIRDDGRGFDPTDLDLKDRGNGLASMRRRTAEIGGEFSITSAPGRPTEIRASFPVENLSATIS
jgi:signal transduction histidine kinase